MRRPGAEVIATVIVCSASEPQLEAICDRLIDDRYAPLPAATASAASRLCRYGRAELLILDLGLPHHAALSLLRERTEWDDFPDIGVLALMDRGDDPAVLTDDPALAVDDYLKRPFILDELRHRLETILRRRHSRDDVVVRLGELLVDPARRKVMVGEREVHLARKEFVLLRVLASDPTRVFSKDELLRAVWGLRHTPGRTRTLDSHASRLRRKLDPEHRRFVVNCWGIGYRLLDSLDDAEPVVEETGGEDR
jgi:DNA-binding response OmpR family regulator